jgi:crotonobetainyl-CoA:carnitine CoA-transferase CaiB-like acyl-CoA transferase
MRPLEGVKVIDLSRYLAGPYCASLLGDMGADVIKIEPTEGEYLRHVGPLYEGESLYFTVMNRNKRGMTLDTRTDDAKEVLSRMFKSADIVITNYRPGVMDKMGFPWGKLHESNPGLILVSISGYGQTGPMAKTPGYDSLAQAMFGLMSMTGPADGEPYLAGSFLIDYATGIYSALGAVLALQTRQKTGLGQRVDTCLLDSALSLQVDGVPVEALLKLHRKRMGNLDRNSAPVGNFRTSDGKFVFIVAGPDQFFSSLMKIIGREELIKSPKFEAAMSRYEHTHEINGIVAEWVAEHTRPEVIDLLEGQGVPVGPVLETWEALQLPQVGHNEMIVEFPYTGLGKIPMAGFPIKMSETPAGMTRGAPRLGEQTWDILSELGYSGSEKARLKANHTV